jgi:hypothetical protein
MDGPNIDRGNPNHTLNFRVPAAHCIGTISFAIQVFDPAKIDDPDYSFTDTIFKTFDVVPEPPIHGIPASASSASTARPFRSLIQRRPMIS